GEQHARVPPLPRGGGRRAGRARPRGARRAGSAPESDVTDPPIRPPSAALLLLEARVWLEFAALLPALPWLSRAPLGDGHPVLVLPGWLASDVSTRALRRFLRTRGYEAHGWGLGRNVGPTPEVVAGLARRLAALRSRHGRRASLIGWSLGGIYARELA